MEEGVPFMVIPAEKAHIFKRVGICTNIMKPAIKEGGFSSKAVYYAECESNTMVAKLYQKKDFPEISTKAVQDLFQNSGGKRIVRTKNLENFYFVTDLCNCGSLDKYTNEKIVLTESQLVEFVRQIGEQLHALHCRKIYHGEICPSNILVNISSSKKLEYKICGLGHTLKKKAEAYRAPELEPYLDPRIIADPFNKYDSACDLWSLGMIVYQLATGVLPVVKHGDALGLGVESYMYYPNQDLSPVLNHFIAGCLDASPTSRILAEDIPYLPLFLPVRSSMDPFVLLEDRLGSGKFANVYLGKRKDDPNSRFAIKVLNPLKELDKKQQMLVLGEISILMKIKKCPYTVRLYDFFEYKGKVHLVLEYCNGGDLEGYLKRKDVNTCQILEELRIVVGDLAEALKYIHSYNLIHRDLKPMNILINIDPKTKRLISAKLADFGCSRQASVPVETMVGSIGFFAPEMIEQGIYGVKIDTWSFGIILFYLAYRLTPIMVDPSHNVYSSRRIKYPDKPVVPVSEDFMRMMKRCLEFNPDKRPSMEEVTRMDYLKKFVITPMKEPLQDYAIGDFMSKVADWALINTVHTASKTMLVTKMASMSHNNDKGELNDAVKELLALRGCDEIYRLHFHFYKGTDICFVMDYCDGQTLLDYVAKMGKAPIPARMISYVGSVVVKALEYMHSRGLYHRRITPNSIYICGTQDNGLPVAKLAGINNFVQDIVGKKTSEPAWIVHKKGKDEREDYEDIYALGALIYFLLYGNVSGYCTPINFPKKDGIAAAEFEQAASVVRRCLEEKGITAARLLEDPFFYLYTKGGK